ncbi:MAG: hypothetical protein V1674_06200 [Candidatus Omnitrophota bacterium]
MTRPEKNRISSCKKNFDKVNKGLTEKDKKRIEAAVKKTVKEYGETLRLLGRA